MNRNLYFAPLLQTTPMRKLFSTKYSAASFSIAMFLLRLVSGALIMNHGYGKLMKFSSMKGSFMNFLGLGSTTSLSLVIFAEFFCGLFLIIGLFTRAVVIPLIIVMIVALFHVHKIDFYGEGEKATLFLGSFLAILLVGPGRASIDGMIGK
ncbi:MAG: DoxX family protein [Ferruginibacter sp.]